MESPIATGGLVSQILISQERGCPIISVPQAEAVTGCGLVGDRHFCHRVAGTTDKNVTLIESEMVSQFARATGLDFTAEDARRNIVTTGVELNPLVGQEFFIGSVVVRALELCEPCSLLARRTHRVVLWGLVHKGGLRCRIVKGGPIRVGDVIRLTSAPVR